MPEEIETSKRVLVVEDEYFIATDLQRVLEARGWEVAGPVGNVAAGLTLVEHGQVDAAVLDVNLEGDHSYAIADRLAERAIPFVFVTGYDGWALPPRYRAAPRITKPFAPEALEAALTRICGAGIRT